MRVDRENNAAMSREIHQEPLRIRILQGVGVAVLEGLMGMFLRPADGTLSPGTRVIVLTVMSLGGAVGGIAYYASDPWRARGGIFKTAANVAAILTFCAAAIGILVLWAVLGGGPHP